MCTDCAVFTHNNGLWGLKSVSFFLKRVYVPRRKHVFETPKTKRHRLHGIFYHTPFWVFWGSQTHFEGKREIPIHQPRITTNKQRRPPSINASSSIIIIIINNDNTLLWCMIAAPLLLCFPHAQDAKKTTSAAPI